METEGEDANPVIVLENVKEGNVEVLKKLNAVLFPFPYTHTFYNDVLSSGDYSKLGCVYGVTKMVFYREAAYYGEACVGNITSKLEKNSDGMIRLYIMTLGVLAPYRRFGIGSKLLKNSLDLCTQDPKIIEIYLHVQTNNEDAIAFYKSFGFRIKEIIPNYFRRIEPPDCYVLSKRLASCPMPNENI